MIDILAMQQALPLTPFQPPSRYASLRTAKVIIGGGEIVYVTRRFVPDPASLTVVGEHTVLQGERLDHVAARALGDPEFFWRICDANRALWPGDLMVLGARLLIPLPEGVQGVPGAP